jgi:L-fuconate dehydratase
VVNAMLDLCAKREGKPLWKLLSDMTPEQIVALVDFRHVSDALTPQQALDMLRAQAGGRSEREAALLERGYPAYTTSAGWLGYDDGKLRRLLRESIAQGFTYVKLKVGRDLADDLRRLRIAREALGPSRHLMVDANQTWDVDQAIDWIAALRHFDLHWVEEPTSPDDVLGHARIARAVAPIGIATGEHVHNRVMFKQLLASGAMSFCQVDACRLGGVNEVIAVLLLAHRFGVPVCPHAGGVGLCEMVQHLAMFDLVAVSGSTEGRVVEYVDHLHEHFLDPVEIRGAHYVAPRLPGYSTQIRAESIAAHLYPGGSEWAGAPAALRLP